MEVISEKLTLEEYKIKLDLIKGLACEELAEIADDEVLLVVSRWREDEDLIRMGSWYELFIDFDMAIEYILNSSQITADRADGEEPIKNRLFWEVCKCKRVGKKMEEMIVCHFGTDGKLLEVDMGWRYNIQPPDSLTKLETHILDYEYLLYYPHNIVLPYKTGDILLVDALPFGKPFYAVYGGEAQRGERLMSDHSYYHWCLYMSEDRQGLWISDLACFTFTDYISFCNSPLNRISLAKTCDEPLIVKASEALKENPDLWFEWGDIWSKNRSSDEGGLEQWIFADSKD